MSGRNPNPRLIKVNRTYTAKELSQRLGVHKNTIRNWQGAGLKPIDDTKPFLFHGTAIRAFLLEKSDGRKRPCPAGTFYCFSCREPRKPALLMVDFVEWTPGSGNLRAICEVCETIMHRRTRRSALAEVMPGIAVQIKEAPERLK